MSARTFRLLTPDLSKHAEPNEKGSWQGAVQGCNARVAHLPARRRPLKQPATRTLTQLFAHFQHDRFPKTRQLCNCTQHSRTCERLVTFRCSYRGFRTRFLKSRARFVRFTRPKLHKQQVFQRPHIYALHTRREINTKRNARPSNQNSSTS